MQKIFIEIQIKMNLGNAKEIQVQISSRTYNGSTDAEYPILGYRVWSLSHRFSLPICQCQWINVNVTWTVLRHHAQFFLPDSRFLLLILSYLFERMTVCYARTSPTQSRHDVFRFQLSTGRGRWKRVHRRGNGSWETCSKGTIKPSTELRQPQR